MTNIAIENGPFIVDLPIENGDFPIFSMVMLVYQRVYPLSLFKWNCTKYGKLARNHQYLM